MPAVYVSIYTVLCWMRDKHPSLCTSKLVLLNCPGRTAAFGALSDPQPYHGNETNQFRSRRTDGLRSGRRRLEASPWLPGVLSDCNVCPWGRGQTTVIGEF